MYSHEYYTILFFLVSFRKTKIVIFFNTKRIKGTHKTKWKNIKKENFNQNRNQKKILLRTATSAKHMIMTRSTNKYSQLAYRNVLFLFITIIYSNIN